VKVKPTESTYVAAAAYDGVPGDPNRTTGSAIAFDQKDGLLLVSEIGFTPKAADTEDEVNKLAIGGWMYTGAFNDLTALGADGNAKRTESQGAYLLSSYRFYHDAKAGRDMGAFFRAGVANDDAVRVDMDVAVGVVGNGWVPTRPEAEIGLGLTQARNGDNYMKSQAAAATPADRAETSYELYYRDRLADGVRIQPDVQYVVNPGTDTTTKDALVLGARLDLSF
jgi:porin